MSSIGIVFSRISGFSYVRRIKPSYPIHSNISTAFSSLATRVEITNDEPIKELGDSSSLYFNLQLLDRYKNGSN